MRDTVRSTLHNINILRAICALGVFLYHAFHNMGCRFGFFNPIISQSSFFMTAFFMLSGFILYFNYSDKDIFSKEGILSFYFRRILGIYPLYFIVWVFAYLLLWQRSTVFIDLLTFPFQFLLIQNFQGYPYLLNSGTWFFSCIMICYFFAPFIIYFTKVLPKFETIVYLSMLFLVLACFPQLTIIYKIDIYSNAFMRLFEFALGSSLCKLFCSKQKLSVTSQNFKYTFSATLILISSFAAIHYFRTHTPLATSNQECLKPLNITCVGLILVLYAYGKTVFGSRGMRFVAFISKYSLEFWVATFFTVEIYNRLLFNKIHAFPRLNPIACVITLFLNILITCLLSLYNHYAKKICSRHKPTHLALFAAGIILLLIAIKFAGTIPHRLELRQHKYIPGETIYFGSPHRNCDAYVVSGISRPENGYAWTDGKKAVLKIRGLSNVAYNAHFRLAGFYGDKQKLTIEVNGQDAFSTTLSSDNPQMAFDFTFVSSGAKDTIILLFPDAESPFQRNQSLDSRRLALRLAELTIAPIDK